MASCSPSATRADCWHLIRIGPGWRWAEREMPVRLNRTPERSGGSGKLARGTEFATQIPQTTRKPHLDKVATVLFDIVRSDCCSGRWPYAQKWATIEQLCGNFRA